MKTLLLIAPVAVLLSVSCAWNTPAVATLPPVVEKKAAATSKPNPKKRVTRNRLSSPKPDATATTLTEEKVVDPLIPDPLNVTPVTDITKFEVPENIQPKFSGGINQGEFIELKW